MSVLADFLISNAEEIITRAQARVAAGPMPPSSTAHLVNGVPTFLEQLGDALRLASAGGDIDHEQLCVSAGRHGADLLRMGHTVAQVVRDYGHVCQAITELAVEQNVSIPSAEFQTLNLCLDDAIAGAVSAYSELRETAIAEEGAERLGSLAHEFRNLVNTAMLSFETIRTGLVSPAGSTGIVHARSLMGLRDLVDRSLADVRLEAGMVSQEQISVAEFIQEVEISALIQAHARSIRFDVQLVDRSAIIQGDRLSLTAALSNLLQNAFKFTRREGHVSLRTRVTADRVLFEVEDECGGLPPGKVEELFRPFQQRGSDRSGVGLGLSICLRAAKANAGAIHVKDLPGKGCVFTLDLPRKPLPPLSVVGGGKREPGGGPGPGSQSLARSQELASRLA